MISPFFLKDIFTGYRILCQQFFSFRSWKYQTMRSYCVAQGAISRDRPLWKIIWEKECIYVWLGLCSTAEVDSMLYIKYTLIKNKLKKKISSNFFLASVFSKEECTSLSIVFHLWVMYHFLLAAFKIFFFFFCLVFRF